MRALLYLLVLAVAVPPLAAQRLLAAGDTVQIEYRMGQSYRHYLQPTRLETRRVEGLFSQLTADSVILDGTAGLGAVARKDVLSMRRLAGRGFDWQKATVPMAVGGALGLILGAAAVADDKSLSGTESALGIAAYGVVGVVPGFTKGLDSHGRTGFTIGAVVGAAAGLAIGLATMPEPPPPCDPSSPFCFDLPDLSGLYVIAVAGAGAAGGGLIGGVIGSIKPGKRWEKLPLPSSTTLGLRRLPGGRVGLAISVGTH